MHLPIEGIQNAMISDAFLERDSLPPRLVLIGGGFISFEFAHFAARLAPAGGSIVILEAGPRPLGPFDEEMVALLVQASQAEGIAIQTGVDIVSVEALDAGFKVNTAGHGSFETDLVVHGAGRTPNIEALDLTSAGIRHDKRGIAVDNGMRTSNGRVYAVGDCAATIQLARVADYEAQVAARNILADRGVGAPAAIDYAAVPALLFTYPQYGMVGRTEAGLKADGISYDKSTAQNLGWPTYRRIGMQHAGYKILADAAGNILGAHILSDNAGGMINTLRMAMLNGIPAGELYRQCIMTPYPSRESDLTYMLKPLA